LVSWTFWNKIELKGGKGLPTSTRLEFQAYWFELRLWSHLHCSYANLTSTRFLRFMFFPNCNFFPGFSFYLFWHLLACSAPTTVEHCSLILSCFMHFHLWLGAIPLCLSIISFAKLDGWENCLDLFYCFCFYFLVRAPSDCFFPDFCGILLISGKECTS
jgi:hypothetical protein